MTTAFVPGVMGRGAVLNTSMILGIVGLLNLLGVNTSTAVDSLGPRIVEVVCAIALVAGAAAAVGCWAATRWADEEVAVVLERAGALCTIAGLGGYGIAVVHLSGFDGNHMVLALTFAPMLNIAARHCHLLRRERAILRQTRAACDGEGGDQRDDLGGPA